MRLSALVLCSLLVPTLASAGDLDSAAKQLVADWLKAQNQGDFKTYSSFYAQRFTGIRRSGPRTVRLDRAGWMKDRARMFKSPMKVEATNLKITAASTVVSFTQTWQSGTYKDVGPKELVIVVEKGAPKIAREELLSSNLEKPAPFRERATFVLDGKWVLIDDGVDESAALGAPTLEGKSNAQTAWKKVKADALPAAARAWQGKRLTVWGKDGKSCTTTVTSLQIVSRSYVHFGQLEEWKDKPAQDYAPFVWEQGAKSLMGVLGAECKEARFARDAALPTAPIVVAAAPSATQRKAAIAALRALPRYADLQKSWLAESDATKGAWEEVAPGAAVEIGVFAYGAHTYVSITATAGEGCGGWSGDVWALYEQVGDKLVLRNKPGSGPTVSPTHAVDTDGDGAPEFLFEQPWWDLGTDRGLVRPHGDRKDEYLKLEAPFHDCPC